MPQVASPVQVKRRMKWSSATQQIIKAIFIRLLLKIFANPREQSFLERNNFYGHNFVHILWVKR